MLAEQSEPERTERRGEELVLALPETEPQTRERRDEPP
jgi:hypothetical protein